MVTRPYSTTVPRPLTALKLCASASLLLAAFSAQADLIDHWNFEEAAGTTTADSGIGSNTGTLGAGASWSTTEFAPNGSTASIQFDGTDLAHVEIKSYTAPLVGGTNNRTISAWVKTNGASPADINLSILSYGRNFGGQKWNFRSTQDNTTLNPSGQLRTEVNGGYIIGTTSVTDGQWHHVAVVLNGGTPDVTELSLYVDGVLEGIHSSLTEAINTDTAGGTNVFIGDDHSNREWNGWLDDVRIYNEALDASAIALIASTVPEPSTLAFTVLGMLCIARRLWRTRQLQVAIWRAPKL